MLKINLLPVRALKKKETAMQQIAIFCIVVFVAAAIISFLMFIKKAQISTAKAEINSANIKIADLKTRIGKLEEVKTLKDQVKKKLDVLMGLRKNKTGPAQRLASLSDITPDQLWLTSYSETGFDVKLSGIAYTEELIAQYMKSLEKSNDFMSVELLVSEQLEVTGIKMKKFDLTLKIRPTQMTAASSQQPDASVKK